MKRSNSGRSDSVAIVEYSKHFFGALLENLRKVSDLVTVVLSLSVLQSDEILIDIRKPMSVLFQLL